MILAGIACTFGANAQQYQASLNKANILLVSFKLKNSSLRVIGTTNDSLTISVLGAGPANLIVNRSESLVVAPNDSNYVQFRGLNAIFNL